MTNPTSSALTGPPVTTLFGDQIAGSISVTAHEWTADASGLFHTSTNLSTEWNALYQRMLAGDTAGMTAIQHLEGNAQAVFLNTGLNKLSATQQEVDREDAQREYDALGAAMDRLALGARAFTTNDYLAVERTIQSDVVLQELSIQGHGLNSPPEAKYTGYTNDFQNNVDQTTLFIGGGLDNNQRAITDFFDDVTLSHVPFPTVAQDGHLEQLNQNADSEDRLSIATGALDDAMFLRVYHASDFSTTPGTSTLAPTLPPPNAVVLTGNQILSFFGQAIAGSQTIDTGLTARHVWTVDGTGTYQLSNLSADQLTAEWKADYAAMKAGHAGILSGIQRLEGNAEAVFENTGLAGLSASKSGNITLSEARADTQRVFDAMAAAMARLGLDGKTALSMDQYRALEHTLQYDPALQELALQGVGIEGTGLARYDGYARDFQYVDTKTLFVDSTGAAGLNNGERALPEFFADNILGNLAFAAVARNGELIQLNRDGQEASTLQQSIAALNTSMSGRTYLAADFNIPGSRPVGTSEPVPGSETTLWGASIATTMVAGGHTWVADASGLFHTATNLKAEWASDYQRLLAGDASLTTEQRWQANAEAVFENTSLASVSIARAQSYREDAQREFDAVIQTMTNLGLSLDAQITNQSYLRIEQALQGNIALEELGVQGHGLNSPPLAKYNGYTNDFQNNVDRTTNFIGGGLDNGQNALTDFFDDVVMSHLPFPTIAQNGTLEQLNQNAADEDQLAVAVGGLNEAIFTRVFVAGDFSKTATAGGPEITRNVAPPAADPVAGANQILTRTGMVIADTITTTAHRWQADSTGLFQTGTDLILEWYTLYHNEAVNGAGYTVLQRMEANAEAVFENTGLSKLSEHQQMVDRSDLQREFDAIYKTLQTLGLDKVSALTSLQYLQLEHSLQSNATLEELAIQGHGLNTPPSARYTGYTNDFQNNVDQRTLYLGSGNNAGERAIADFLDDSLLSHVPFATVAINGELVQLNQNGDSETKLAQATAAVDQTWFKTFLTAADFGKPGYQPPAGPDAGPATITTLTGETVSGTVTITPHVWTANAAGLYVTTANLEIEWRTYAQTMAAGHADTLTAIQRLEGNAEVVFENTGMINLSEATISRDRMDAQREYDAMAAAMKIDQAIFGIDPSKPLTGNGYIQLERTMNDNAQLAELGVQGHGLNNPPSALYRGYTNDFQNNVDNATLFIGGGLNHNQKALADLFDDSVLSHTPFSVVFQNGVLTQLNQNGDTENTLREAVLALDDSMYSRVFTAADFSKTASTKPDTYVSPNAAQYDQAAAAGPGAGQIKTLYGDVIANTVTINSGLTNTHVWTADKVTGQFHTGDLTTEWQGYYQTMLAGGGASLTSIQRLEGNAEAVLEATGLTKLGTGVQQAYREDAQRQFDAMAQALKIDATTLGLDVNAQFTSKTLLEMERTIQNNAPLQELSIQGHGLNNPPAVRYTGFTNDFQTANTHTRFIGGGSHTNQNALNVFFDDVILGHQPFPTVWHNGTAVQLNQNGNREVTLATAVADLNDSAFLRTFKKTDFSK